MGRRKDRARTPGLWIATHTLAGEYVGTIPSGDWVWASCSAENPFPGTPAPTQICLRSGFDPTLLYQVVFTAQDPPVLGIGFAAFRDVASFLQERDRGRGGLAEPAGESGHARYQPGPVAVGKLHQRGTQPRVVEGPHAVDLRWRPHGGPCRAEQCPLGLPLPGLGSAPRGGLTTNSRRTGSCRWASCGPGTIRATTPSVTNDFCMAAPSKALERPPSYGPDSGAAYRNKQALDALRPQFPVSWLRSTLHQYLQSG